MPCLNEQRHNEHLQRRKGTEQHFNCHKFQRTAKDQKAHQHRVNKGKPGCVHVDAIGKPQKLEPGKNDVADPIFII